jgi:replication factor C subunit 3/5
LFNISKAEGIKIPEKTLKEVSLQCDNNIRRAIFMLELIRSEQFPFKDESKIKIPETYWEQYIKEIAKDIMQEQTPKRLYEVRAKFYNLLTNCIPADLILRRLADHLMTLDIELQHHVAHWSAFYEHRLELGTKAIFHLEAFVAKFMSVYKKVIVQYTQ